MIMNNIFKKIILSSSFSLLSFSFNAIPLLKTGYPKWDGLIDLQASGLPIPKALFITPYSTPKSIEAIIDDLTSEIDGDLIALRPDGIRGIGKSPPGTMFNKTDKANILAKIKEWSEHGYGITIAETHNRFDYDFCCNILLNEDGSFTIEFVGPGFDGGDLNKGILQPTMTIKSKAESPISIYSDQISGEPNNESLEKLNFRLNITGRPPTKDEINTRLTYIMTRLLPDMGVKIEATIEATIEWLKQNNCYRLLEQIDPRSIITMDDLKTLIYSASLYANTLTNAEGRIQTKALTAHKYNNKIIFFGTYDCHKWGRLS